jgi:hypothetical protein
MLLGLDLDLWTQPLLENAVSSFGQLMIWEEDLFFLARAIVKVRVAALDEIPWFFLFSQRVLVLSITAGQFSVKYFTLTCLVRGPKMRISHLMMMTLTHTNSSTMVSGNLAKVPHLHHLSSLSNFKPWDGMSGLINLFKGSMIITMVKMHPPSSLTARTTRTAN